MAHDSYNRKLKALLCADVVGYSRMMGSNETATLESLTANKSIMAQLIGQGCGRIVDSPGDNLLAEFPSALAAVECAVKIQKAIRTKNDPLPIDQQMTYRIGVNLGEVIDEEGRLYGDCVNITARMQSLASPGSIFISGFIFDQVAGKQPFAYEYLGKQSVKNIDKPVRVYRLIENSNHSGRRLPAANQTLRSKAIVKYAVILGVLTMALTGAYLTKQWKARAPETGKKPAGTELPVIAVLPFQNLSQTAEFDNFTDALTDDIITNLTQLSGLAVIAHNSVFAYKNKPTKPQVLAREFNAQFILEGSLRRAGDQILINAQLINALLGFHIWAQRYDLKVKDLMAVQIDITAKIAAALRLSLSDQDRALLQAKGADYLAAYMKKLEAGEQKLPPGEKDRKTEMIFWESVKDSGQSAMYEEYLRKFPEGIFAGLAKLNILNLTASKAAPPAVAKSPQATSKTAEVNDSKRGQAEKVDQRLIKKPAQGLSEEALWRSIQGSKKIKDYEQFVDRFPNSVYSGLARIYIDALSQSPAQSKRLFPDGRRFIAIFREKSNMLCTDSSCSSPNRWLGREDAIAKGLQLALNNKQSFVPKWSAYDLGKEYNIKPPGDGLPKSFDPDRIWKKDPTTGKEIPNMEEIRQLGESLQVNTILMFQVYHYSFFYSRNYYYLVDLEANRIVSQSFDEGFYGLKDFSSIEVRDNILKLFDAP